MYELEEEVLEVVEVPEYGLPVEGLPGVRDREVGVGAGEVNGGEVGERLAVEVEDGRVEPPPLPSVVEEEVVEGLVAEVLLEVAGAVGADGVEFRHSDAFAAQVAAEGVEGLVLADVVVDGADACCMRPH